MLIIQNVGDTQSMLDHFNIFPHSTKMTKLSPIILDPAMPIYILYCIYILYVLYIYYILYILYIYLPDPYLPELLVNLDVRSQRSPSLNDSGGLLWINIICGYSMDIRIIMDMEKKGVEWDELVDSCG